MKHRLRLLKTTKGYRDAFGVVLIAATLAISLTSIAISFQAFRYAQLVSRPYVTLEVVPTKGRFLIANRQGDSAFVGYALKMKNEGQTPAINIMFPDRAGWGRDKQGNPIQFEFPLQPQPIALAAGEEHTGIMGLVIPLTGTNTDIVERVHSGDITVGIDLVIEYQGLTSLRSKYHTGLACKIAASRLVPVGLSLR